MLKRSQVLTLLMIKERESKTKKGLWNKMPIDLIRSMGGLTHDDKTYEEFKTALQHVADGELDELKKILDAASKEPDKSKLKKLLWFYGTVVTPGGLTAENTSLLECALGSGDPEMIETIKSFFPLFEGGDKEMETQLARYRPCIEAMQNQKPDDLTWVFDIIKKSSLQDVQAEQATGEKYNPDHKSDLRTALNKFREMKLDPKNRVMTKPRMHCNYQNLLHAYEKLDSEWDNLKVGTSCDKHDLVAQHIIGLIQLIELPAHERYIFARGQVEEATENKKIERSNNYKYGSGSFPRFDKNVFKGHSGHSGVGFDSFISIYGRSCGAGSAAWATGSFVFFYKTYVEQKQQTCRTYAATSKTEIRRVQDCLNK